MRCFHLHFTSALTHVCSVHPYLLLSVPCWPLCLLLLKVAYCLFPFHLKNWSLLFSPSFLYFHLVCSLSQKAVRLPRTQHISNCCCLFMFSVLVFLVTNQNSLLIDHMHQHPLFYHILCAFACLSLVFVSSITFLFTHDPLYRMHYSLIKTSVFPPKSH